MTAMVESLLERDTDLPFPSFTVLKASAGSGKTYALTERFVQFLLSEKIPQSNLRNILAITFSNNASKEMKERILLWLKDLCLGKGEALAEIGRIVSLPGEALVRRSEQAIHEILSHYTDFQIKTIDSFMTTIFKTSAIDLGFSPDFEILMDSGSLLEYTFNLFLRNVRPGAPEEGLLLRILRIIQEHQHEGSSYLWDPSENLLREVKKLYRKLASLGDRPSLEEEGDREREAKERLLDHFEALELLIARSGLERSGGSAYAGILAAVREGRFSDLIGKGLKAPPVKKPTKKNEVSQRQYDSICEAWSRAGEWVNAYVACYARSYFIPYLALFMTFSQSVDRVRRQQGKVFIEDINHKLGEYLGGRMIPEIYFRLGETIFHFFVDEFQDTSPIQWKNLLPLVENSLSQGGSLFVVGDTKQAIYGFRDADYTIMRECESQNPFSAASHRVLELAVNYRSLPRILEFNDKVFKEAAAGHEKYAEAAQKSGLNDYVQRSSREGTPGYVEVEVFVKDEEDPPERRKIQDLIEELIGRGYSYRNIAILTGRNEDVVKAAAWLNEKTIPFISYSSLDVRRRKTTGEILSLLSFLDSPPDDLAFATFLLGDLFGRTIENLQGREGWSRMHSFLFRNRDSRPLYKAFQTEFGDLWEKCFSGLFRSAGYRPLYDLITEVFNVFDVFGRMGEEEATFAKILETTQGFEGTGHNNLRDFVRFASEEEGGTREWNIDVPRDVDSVSLMTVHKAKGLGFPVVIALIYGERSRGFDYLVQSEKGELRLLKVNQQIAPCSPLLDRLYQEEVINARVDRLNSLYVGFTRAREELYVVGVKAARDGFPFDLIPAHDFPPAGKPARMKKDPERKEEPLSLLHFPAPFSLGEDTGRRLSAKEQWRGDFIHRVFSHIKEVDGPLEAISTKAIEKAAGEMRLEIDWEETKAAVLGILSLQDLKSFFQPKSGREIRTEQEISDAEGRLFRVDRLVMDERQITVIDFKTGNDKAGERGDEAQIRNYLKILKEVHPERTLEGWLVYVDRKEGRRVL